MPSLPSLLTVLLACATAASAAELRLRLTDAKDRPVADAVAYLAPTEGAAPRPEPMRSVELVQHGQEFIPFVTVVTTGTPVSFPNRDTVQHHVYSLSKAKKFELPLYNPGKAETIVFDQPGVVTLGCNIHDWMLAYLLVLDTSWFAKTDEHGTAVISAPPGRYRLQLWHPRLKDGGNPGVVELAEPAGPVRTLVLTLKPDHRVRRAPDAKAGAY